MAQQLKVVTQAGQRQFGPTATPQN